MDAQRGIARRMVIGLPPGGPDAAWERDFAAYPPAGVIVFRRDFADLEALRALTRRLRELARPRRIFVAMDEEGGHVSQLAGHFEVPPNAMLLGRGAEPGDLEWIARVTARRLRALGVDWVFAPVADVHSEPRNPVIGPRAWGTTSDAVTARVGEVLRGFRAERLAACLKHFPGHGDTVHDSHVGLPVSEAARDALERRELAPFAAHRDADAVMTAHVVYRALDSERPATFSPAIVRGLLRDALGFAGVAITDALEMKGAAAGRGPADVGRAALEAGCDLVLYAWHDDGLRRARLELARALAEGRMDRAAFDAARPRLAALDRASPEPSEAELALPLAALTPGDWSARLEAIVARGLIVSGAAPPVALAGPWRFVQAGPRALTAVDAELAKRGLGEAPPSAEDVPLAAELARAGFGRDDGAGARAQVIVVRARQPLSAEETERLRARARELPTVLVGLQNDAFLDDVPEAALRVSASDATPITRDVVARRIAAEVRGAGSRS